MAEKLEKPAFPQPAEPTRLRHLERFDHGTPQLASMMRTSAELRELYRGSFPPQNHNETRPELGWLRNLGAHPEDLG